MFEKAGVQGHQRQRASRFAEQRRRERRAATTRTVHRGRSRLSTEAVRRALQQFRAFAIRVLGTVAGQTRTPPEPVRRANTAPAVDEGAPADKAFCTLGPSATNMSNDHVAAPLLLARSAVMNLACRLPKALHIGIGVELAVRAVKRRRRKQRA
jgi:hypothetical protein